MGKALVIAEKPSVGRDLAAALPGRFEKHEAFLESDEYVITWAVGHLVELAEPEDYDERLKKWRMADLPIVPDGFRLKPRDAKSRKQLSAIRKLLARPDVDRVINACDAGREGELIFAYIYESAGATKPVDRLWISSMTKQAIREGFERLRPGSQLEPLQAAARSRSEADWLVGMNATRAATIRGRAWVGGVVSLGRVQTPTLAMIVKREREIQAFVPEPYWLVRAAFQPLYEGLWFERDETRIKKAARADEIVERVSSNDGVVDSVERKEQSERAPLLYDLTSLQRDANRRFGFSARRTLQAAQSLYEGKKAITYPRTSSRYLSGDMVPQLKPTAATLQPIADFRKAAEYVLALDQLPLQRVVNDAKVDDHHAVIPTDIDHDMESLTPDERRVFDLVARRFLAVFHPPARYARTTVITLVEEEELREAMKDSGLGTPATRAETIETLIRREYIERVGKDLQATPKGIQVITMLEEHKLTSPELTGDWEHKLSDIEHGRGDRSAFMRGIADFAKETVEQIAALDKEKLRPERVELGPCPRCGAETGEIIRENSKAYGCTSWKSREETGCGFVIWKRVASRTLTPEIARQLLEEGRTREVLSGFRSRAGKPFRARLVLNDEGKTEFEFPARTETVQPTAAE